MEYTDTDLDEIRHHPLFHDIDDAGIRQLFHCFNFRHSHFQKEEYIVMEGEPVPYVAVVLSGAVLMEKSDLQGNNYFFTEIRVDELFGDAFIGSRTHNSTVNYKAMTNCSVLLFEYKNTRQFCQKSCRCHLLFSENLMYLIALKSRTFLAKLEILSTKSLRDRILRFLHIMDAYPDIIGLHGSKRQQGTLEKNQVFVPFNHTELAEYLGVNRSALVRELGRMEEDGILSFDKHHYTLCQLEEATDEN